MNCIEFIPKTAKHSEPELQSSPVIAAPVRTGTHRSGTSRRHVRQLHAPQSKVQYFSSTMGTGLPTMPAFTSPSMPMPQQAPRRSVSARPRFVQMQAEESASDAKDVCAACGRPGGAAAGCDGDGRVVGGLGAILSWWPIKAYRPCPDFLKTKQTYRRAGQSLEEIAFGRKGAGDDKSLSERLRGE